MKNHPSDPVHGRSTETRDRGSVLAMTLVMTIVSSLLVMALLAFISTVLRVRPPIEERAVASETARSAIRQAVHQQRINGPDDCYDNAQVIEINGLDAEVNCYVTDINYDNALMLNRFGVITTANRFEDGTTSIPSIYGSDAATPPVKEISGDVFINATSFDVAPTDVAVTGDAADGSGSPAGMTGSNWDYPAVGTPLVPDTRYELATLPLSCDDAALALTTAGSPSMNCIAESWTARAGYNPDPSTLPWSYPYLPPIPSQTRSQTNAITFTRNGTPCTILYPGNYPNGLDLSGGDFYFASGIYYFEAPVTVRNGARAVGGEGTHSGCVLDSEAALFDDGSQRAPKVHGITGNGTTFLLGDNATLDVTRASLLLNRRLSTPTTRATEGISIRSVNTVVTDSANVYVPEDQIFDQEGNPVVNSSSTAYMDSDALDPSAIRADWLYPIVRFDTTSGGGDIASATNPYEFSAGGAVFVPNAAIEVKSENSFYTFEITGGTVSTRLGIDLDELPSNPSNFFLGAKKTAVQSEFRFDALVTSPSGRETVSSSIMQLNISQEYALNSWTLDIGVVGVDPTNGGAGVGSTYSTGGTGGGGTSGSGTSGGSTGTPTTTVTTTTVPTTGGPTTTVPTTTVPADPCLATPSWQGEYWNNTTLSGTPDATQASSDINFDWGTGSPAGVSADGFSARWTRTITVPSDATYNFTVGGDDGTRLYIDGTLVYDDWNPHAYATGVIPVALSASCGSEIVMEFYEGTGEARATLTYDVVSGNPCTVNDSSWTGEYWDNKTLSGTPDLTRQDSAINFNWSNNSAPVGSDYNNFSVRWTKNIVVSSNTMYDFTIGGDDGVRLYVNDVLVINDWSDHGYRTSTGSAQLNASCSNKIVMEFYENGGSARATLGMNAVVPETACTNTPDANFSGDYFNGRDLTNWRYNQQDAVIDFEWPNDTPDNSQLGSKYSIRWTKTVNFPSSGTYTFTAAGSDGVRLYITPAGGSKIEIINDWSNHNYRSSTGTYTFGNTTKCGAVVTFEYYQRDGNAKVKLNWAKNT